MTFQTVLSNRTPFAVQKFVLVDPEGQEALLVVVAASFETGKDGRFEVAAEQVPVRVADEYAGEPVESSLVNEGELALSKPRVDVVINGTAYAPRGRPAPRVAVEVMLGDIRKSLVVSGPRVWSGGTPTNPVPFAEMPIRYERAFGGVSPRNGTMFVRNPVGVGYDGAVCRDDERSQLPSVEYANALVANPSDKPPPAGLRPIARWWQPRASFAGTYDAAWLQSRWPVLPADFDPRYNQCAPLDQQSDRLVGGESAHLVNLAPDGDWTFRVPTLRVPAQFFFDTGRREMHLRVDTVTVDPDARRVRLTARVAIVAARGNRIREIVVGNMTKGWLRARDQRKWYVDLGGALGVNRAVPVYET